MTTCKMCPAPLTGRRKAYCSDACSDEARRVRFRQRYHSDTAFAEYKRTAARRWSRMHPKRATARRKAARFAAVLQRVPDAGRRLSSSTRRC